jgi:hypothetical protein
MCAIFVAGSARAADRPAENEYLIDADFGLGSGLEGGDPGSGRLAWRRARLRVETGIDLRTDEARADALGLRAFIELEKRGSLGAEVRYERWLTRSVGVYAGLIGTVAPETLFGGGVGGTLVIPFGRRVGLYLEPSFHAMPLGSDLPSKSVLIWGLFSAGLKLEL